MLSSETYRPGREEMSTDDGLKEGGNEDSSNMLTHVYWGKQTMGLGRPRTLKPRGPTFKSRLGTLCEALDKLLPH